MVTTPAQAATACPLKQNGLPNAKAGAAAMLPEPLLRLLNYQWEAIATMAMAYSITLAQPATIGQALLMVSALDICSLIVALPLPSKTIGQTVALFVALRISPKRRRRVDTLSVASRKSKKCSRFNFSSPKKLCILNHKYSEELPNNI